MKDIIVLLTICLTLVACKDESSSPVSANPKSSPKFSVPSEMYANTVVDCVGFRVIDTVLVGEFNNVSLFIRLNRNSSYKIFYGHSWAVGPWTETAYGIDFRDAKINVKFAAGRALPELVLKEELFSIPAGTRIPLTIQQVQGLEGPRSRAANCSPSDNEDMNIIDNHTYIAGELDTRFWQRTLMMNKEGEPLVGMGGTSYYHKGLAKWVKETRLYFFADHVIVLRNDYRMGDNPNWDRANGEVVRWHIEDGLVVLEDWGIMTPVRWKTDSHLLVPVLYLSKDASGVPEASGPIRLTESTN